MNIRCLASIGRRLPPNLKRVCLYDDRLDVPRIEGWQLLAVAPIAAPHGDLSNHYTRAGVYTKLHVWNLTSYSAVLYLDLDTLPMRSVYPVFSQQLPAMLAAHQTVGMALDSLAPFDAHSFNAGSYSLPDAPPPLCISLTSSQTQASSSWCPTVKNLRASWPTSTGSRTHSTARLV